MTIEADSARGDVLQAGDQIADGGLAGSAGADDGSELARLPHVGQPNLTTNLAQHDRVGRLDDLGLEVEVGEGAGEQREACC